MTQRPGRTVDAGWQPAELGLVRALLVSGLAVAILVLGMGALLFRPPALQISPPVMVQLVELPLDDPAAGPSLPAPATQRKAEAMAEPAVAAAPNAAPLSPSASDSMQDVAAATPKPPLPAVIAVNNVPAVDADPAVAIPVRPDAKLGVPTALAPPATRLVPRAPEGHSAARRRPVERQAAVGRPAPTLVAPVAAQAPASPALRLPPEAVVAVADTSSGIGPYRAGLHKQIERNVIADAEVRSLGLSGIAVIEATIAPDGRVLSAHVARGSGSRSIDRAALAAVQRGGYGAFLTHMPAGPITISVPIEIGAD